MNERVADEVALAIGVLDSRLVDSGAALTDARVLRRRITRSRTASRRHRAAVRHSGRRIVIRLVEVRAEEHRTADFRTRLHVRPYADDRFLDQALVEITASATIASRKSQSLNANQAGSADACRWVCAGRKT